MKNWTRSLTFFTLAKVLLLLWAVMIVVNIILDPLGDHSIWQPLCVLAGVLALDRFQKKNAPCLKSKGRQAVETVLKH